MFKKRDTSELSSEPNSQKASRQTPLWLVFVLPIVSILVFFSLLEGGLALIGIAPASHTEDPLVGFTAYAPLFAPATGTNGQKILTTAMNKVDFFNRQSFPLEKTPNTYRIFSLGGSTTYGRPYDDSTSFTGWLRELLPAADKTKNWEVINAGGISYASYRLAKLMEELIQYKPDMFIIYTGHNEFLEERTYRKIKDIPPLIRSTASLLAKTRTWSAMTGAIKSLGISPHAENKDGSRLSSEVDAILDRSAGLESYKRDDVLQANVLKHFRISLEQMVVLARSVGARVVFVIPGSNLKDCSPFKSQDTTGINNANLQRSKELMTMTKPIAWEKEWELVLNFLNQAIKLNPRFADLRYRRGQALLAIGRFKEAKRELIKARDEDVCPLRALTPMSTIIEEVSKKQKASLINFNSLLEKRMLKTRGHAILGEEYFLDHVHPTIEGHKLLAIALLEAMTRQGLVRTGPDWGEKAIAAVATKIEGGVDKAKQGWALANLARVFLWAGKNEDAARLAKQALDIGGKYQQVAINATASLSTVYVRIGQPKLAVKLLYSYLEKAPNAVELRLKLGQILMDRQLMNLEEAAANLLLVSQQMPHYDWAHALFGIDMAERGRPRIAYSSLMEALRLNPNNTDARQKLAQISSSLAGQDLNPQPPIIKLARYPSAAPLRLVQGRFDSNGKFIPDGIIAEFHKNGRLKKFIDIDHGKAINLEMTWDTNGKLLSK